jgi:hypothetical protein
MIGRMDSTTDLGGLQHWRVVILWRDFQARLEVRMSNQWAIWTDRCLLADKSSLGWFGNPEALLTASTNINREYKRIQHRSDLEQLFLPYGNSLQTQHCC